MFLLDLHYKLCVNNLMTSSTYKKEPVIILLLYICCILFYGSPTKYVVASHDYFQSSAVPYRNTVMICDYDTVYRFLTNGDLCKKGYCLDTISPPNAAFPRDMPLFHPTNTPEFDKWHDYFQNNNFEEFTFEMFGEHDLMSNKKVDFNRINTIIIKNLYYHMFHKIPSDRIVKQCKQYIKFGGMTFFSNTIHVNKVNVIIDSIYADVVNARQYSRDIPVRSVIKVFLFAGLLSISSTMKSIVQRFSQHYISHYSLFKKDPEKYILEHLRLDSPVPTTTVILKQPYKVTLGTQTVTLEPGTPVCINLASANCDSTKFGTGMKTANYARIFDPDRANLNEVIVFNGTSTMRICPASNIVIQITKHLCQKLFYPKHNQDIQTYVTQDISIHEIYINNYTFLNILMLLILSLLKRTSYLTLFGTYCIYQKIVDLTYSDWYLYVFQVIASLSFYDMYHSISTPNSLFKLYGYYFVVCLTCFYYPIESFGWHIINTLFFVRFIYKLYLKTTNLWGCVLMLLGVIMKLLLPRLQKKSNLYNTVFQIADIVTSVVSIVACFFVDNSHFTTYRIQHVWIKMALAWFLIYTPSPKLFKLFSIFGHYKSNISKYFKMRVTNPIDVIMYREIPKTKECAPLLDTVASHLLVCNYTEFLYNSWWRVSTEYKRSQISEQIICREMAYVTKMIHLNLIHTRIPMYIIKNSKHLSSNNPVTLLLNHLLEENYGLSGLNEFYLYIDDVFPGSNPEYESTSYVFTMLENFKKYSNESNDDVFINDFKTIYTIVHKFITEFYNLFISEINISNMTQWYTELSADLGIEPSSSLTETILIQLLTDIYLALTFIHALVNNVIKGYQYYEKEFQSQSHANLIRVLAFITSPLQTSSSLHDLHHFLMTEFAQISKPGMDEIITTYVNDLKILGNELNKRDQDSCFNPWQTSYTLNH